MKTNKIKIPTREFFSPFSSATATATATATDDEDEQRRATTSHSEPRRGPSLKKRLRNPRPQSWAQPPTQIYQLKTLALRPSWVAAGTTMIPFFGCSLLFLFFSLGNSFSFLVLFFLNGFSLFFHWSVLFSFFIFLMVLVSFFYWAIVLIFLRFFNVNSFSFLIFF